MKIESIHSHRSSPLTPYPNKEKETAIEVEAIDLHPSGQLPSVFGLFSIPQYFASSLSSLAKAHSFNDKESKLDTRLRITTLPINLTLSLWRGISLILQTNIFLHLCDVKFFTNPLMLAGINIAGLVLCVVELVFETVSLARQVRFLKRYDFNLVDKIQALLSIQDPVKKRELMVSCCKKLKSHKIALDSPSLQKTLTHLEHSLHSHAPLSKILLEAQAIFQEVQTALLEHQLTQLEEKYLLLTKNKTSTIQHVADKTLPPEETVISLQKKELTVKMGKLARRVQPWLAQEMQNTLSPILSKLRSKNTLEQKAGRILAQELLTNLKAQGQKKALVHVLSIITLALTAAAFIGLLASCPPAIPMVLFLIGGAFSISSYLMQYGTLKHKGWVFSWTDCIPDGLKMVSKVAFNKICGSFEWLGEHMHSLSTRAHGIIGEPMRNERIKIIAQ